MALYSSVMASDPVAAVLGLASPAKVIRGCIAFAFWWVFAVFPAVPFLPIGRTAGSLLGATLMVVLLVITPDEAFQAIDLPILALLFGTMVVSEYLKRANLFEYLGQALAWRTKGAMDLLCRVCLLAALSSALFTNDTTCVVLTPFVLELCRDMDLKPKPFLLALASSSNIGSAATPIGNPQNLVIAVNSGISFGRFLAGVLLAVASGLVVNTLLLVAFYGRSLSGYNWRALSVVKAQLPQPEISEDLENGHVKVTLVWNRSMENTDMADHGEARRGSLSRQNSTESVVSNSAPSPDADAAAPTSPDAPSAPLPPEAPSGDPVRLPRQVPLPGAPSPPSPSVAGVEIVVKNHEGAIQIPSDRTLCQDITKLTVKKDSEISRNEAPVSESARRRSEAEFDVGNVGPEHGACRETLKPEISPRNSFRVVSGGDLDAVVRGSESVPKEGGISKACALYTRIVRKNKCASMFDRRFKRLRTTWWKHKLRIWKSSVYFVTLGMLAALLAGLSLPWTALTAAVVMMVLDFSDAGPSLQKVNYALLVFFCGMFIATSGFNQTGVPEVFWSAVEPHSQIGTASGVIVLSVVVTVLSNVVSNVPTVILLGTKVAASAVSSGASSDKAWLILAWVSTVAGNLTLLGSAANIIVAEQARETHAEKGNSEKQSKHLTSGSKSPARATYDLTFWRHLKFGFPSTVVVIAVGLIPIALRKF